MDAHHNFLEPISLSLYLNKEYTHLYQLFLINDRLNLNLL